MANIINLWNGIVPTVQDVNVASITAFKSMIDETWDKKIEANTCISRKHRNIIHEVIRDFMKAYPKMDENKKSPLGAPMQWLTQYYILKNEYHKTMLAYDNGSLNTKFKTLNIYMITNVGQYILYIVFCIISGKNHDGTPYIYDSEITSNDKNLINERIKYACKQILHGQLTIALRIRNKFMFIGSPMYLWFNVNGSQVYHDIYDRNAGFHNKEIGRLLYAFMYYLSISGRFLNDFALLKFTYLGESWTFSLSVPEYILYGLGYSVFDTIEKFSNDAILVYIRTNNRNGYDYVEFNKKGIAKVTEAKPDNDKRIHAIRLINDSSDVQRIHFGFRNMVIINNECANIQSSAENATDTGHHQDSKINIEVEDDDDVIDDDDYNPKPTPIPEPHPRPPFPRHEYHKRPKLLPVEEPDPVKKDADRIRLDNHILNTLDHNLNFIGHYCCDTAAVDRLEHHIETLGQYAVILARKINMQTLLFPWPLPTVHPHAIDGSIPPHGRSTIL
ncbi:P4c [Vaccinia virus]|uniref:Cowpox A-type inclusion protein n=2 Tax=Vaccinia virus TaxID=10245 RepID=M9WEX6_VACCV|nr:P4c [Vaccinia virus]AGJ91613.1 P4c [Vaccinia virus]AGJ91883.1 P4c [Vaccinia virus]AGJ92431.1 P4c [Vaccinia virus]AGK06617.1 cowpox A-type inclusion protein [Vaccinia virus]